VILKLPVKITSFQILLSLSLSACVFTTSDEILLSEFGNEVGSIYSSEPAIILTKSGGLVENGYLARQTAHLT